MFLSSFFHSVLFCICCKGDFYEGVWSGRWTLLRENDMADTSSPDTRIWTAPMQRCTKMSHTWCSKMEDTLFLKNKKNLYYMKLESWLSTSRRDWMHWAILSISINTIYRIINLLIIIFFIKIKNIKKSTVKISVLVRSVSFSFFEWIMLKCILYVYFKLHFSVFIFLFKG